MNIHAIGWGILAMSIAMIVMAVLRAEPRILWSLIIGLAVTLITW
jgi:ABC-type anion transport system duplicated permease subunit